MAILRWQYHAVVAQPPLSHSHHAHTASSRACLACSTCAESAKSADSKKMRKTVAHLFAVCRFRWFPTCHEHCSLPQGCCSSLFGCLPAPTPLSPSLSLHPPSLAITFLNLILKFNQCHCNMQNVTATFTMSLQDLKCHCETCDFKHDVSNGCF